MTDDADCGFRVLIWLELCEISPTIGKDSDIMHNTGEAMRQHWKQICNGDWLATALERVHQEQRSCDERSIKWETTLDADLQMVTDSLRLSMIATKCTVRSAGHMTRNGDQHKEAMSQHWMQIYNGNWLSTALWLHPEHGRMISREWMSDYGFRGL